MRDLPGVDGRLRGSTGGAIVVCAPTQRVLTALAPDRRADPPAGAGPPDASRQDGRVAAHLLVRWCAARLTGEPATSLEVVHQCPECGSAEHGKPAIAGLPELHISLAHRPHAVVAAAGWTPVGVDVETPGPPGGGPAPVPDVLSPAEIVQVNAAADPSSAFLRLWARKECLIKLGVTTLDSLQDVDLAGLTGDPMVGGGTASRYRGLHVADWIDATTGAVVAAAGCELPVRGVFRGA